MLDGEAADLDGAWFAARGARNDPTPVQPRLPLLIGGSGERRTLPIVARCADIWNGEGDPETFARKSALLGALCRARGREPGAVERTVGLPPPLIRAHRTEAVTALAGRLVRHGLAESDAITAAEGSALVGSVADVAVTLARYAQAGASEVIFDWPPPADEATLVALAGPVRDTVEAIAAARR
jgi:alkanesulfonate monooxygenase SsuD/methylene tetrahydromethanopterin reductase-like flavin-dependent oxidoreductase (luciferase family)